MAPLRSEDHDCMERFLETVFHAPRRRTLEGRVDTGPFRIVSQGWSLVATSEVYVRRVCVPLMVETHHFSKLLQTLHDAEVMTVVLIGRCD
jgi:hypothetical protein